MSTFSALYDDHPPSLANGGFYDETLKKELPSRSDV